MTAFAVLDLVTRRRDADGVLVELERPGIRFWAVQGGELEPWTWIGILAWTAVMLALALFLFRRDEGRRYR
jgi:hypothetical protein